MSLPNERLEVELRELGPLLIWPEPEDLVPEMSRRLRAGRRGWGSRKWALVAAALVLLLAAGSLSALPNPTPGGRRLARPAGRARRESR